ncbi:LAFE_0D10088g1_1 [Lachancea fermentati]|uniref:Ribosome biogenesis protein SLX9 n=1 Tax=Lachancea fermentati TaxID=4955 RepID=A0A1G4MBV6_LACFM|nr:LAFE_0D10088g1_1 [Lachancea fermentati]
MVAKKRNQLRTKAALRLNQAAETDPVDVAMGPQVEDPKAFLHQPRETKKEKMYNKSHSFLTKVQQQSSLGAGISKSALRRRKRKLRDDLKPKMHDLLVSLEQEGVLQETMEHGQEHDNQSVTKIVAAKNLSPAHSTPAESGSIVVKKNQPNIRNQKGAKILAQKETQRFSTVLRDQQFQQNPFAALKEVIKMQK